MTNQIDLMDGKLHVYKRDDFARYWQCSACIKGKNYRQSTRQESLAQAKLIAEDWYLELRGKLRIGELKQMLGLPAALPEATTPEPTMRKGGVTFRKAAAKFLDEYEVLTQGQRSPAYVKMHTLKLNAHLLPYFGDMTLPEITAGKVMEYRAHRHKTSKTGKPLARSTLHHEVVTLRLVLKTAHRHRWVDHVPDLSMPYKSSGKVTHRAWFSPEEYKQLYEATRQRAAKPKNIRWKKACEQMHDYVLFMANTGLRPDESARLEYRDVEIVDGDGSDEKILHIQVRGKRGVGYCKSMPGAVRPYERLLKRNTPKPTDRLFGKTQRDLFNDILDELGLKFDRDGQRRTAYSLRHTYISMRLMEGADIYQIAKNCRTSVEMIEKFYASHIKDMLDATAINVRKPKPAKAKPKAKTPSKRKQ